MNQPLFLYHKSEKAPRMVKGPLIVELQKALAAEGQKTLKVDGIFGNDTRRAVEVWQDTNEETKTGVITRDQFNALCRKGGPELSDFEICLQLTAAFEGHGYTKVKGAFDSALITWGIIGFTYQYGSLQKVFAKARELARAEGRLDPVSAAFGDLKPRLDHGLAIETEKDRIDWVKDLSDPDDPDDLEAEWIKAFRKFGSHEIVQQAQLQVAKTEYWEPAERRASHYGLNDLQSKALFFDIQVQNGGLKDDVKEAFSLHRTAAPDEALIATREKLATLVANASSFKWRSNVLARKMCLAQGEGVVHGAFYDLSAWGFPAEPNPKPAKPTRQEFLAFFAGLDLNYFKPEEFAFLGGGHSTPGAKGYGKNELPPTDLWPNMVLTARILDMLREKIGKPVRLTSLYRSADYNAAIGGAAKSAHRTFHAADFYCSDGQSPDHWARILHGFRDEGRFKGGIGIYRKSRFVHLDTNGINRDF